MLNNNHKNSNCAFAEPLISYLYGESSAAEKAEFEAHLETCAACQNELAEFGFARTAVQEWRGLEFDHLPTPAFEIPSNSVEIQTATVSTSWFDGWRQIFAFKPALAMSALVVLIALFGISFLVFNFKDSDEIAKNPINANALKIAVSPTVETISEQPKQIVEVKPNISNAPVADAPTKIVEKKSAALKTPIGRVPTNAPKNVAPEIVPVREVQNTSKGNKKSVAAPNSKVPRLTDAEDEEDNSVRLADLFDEIGTR